LKVYTATAEQVVKQAHINDRRPSTNPQQPNTSKCCTACCLTYVQQIENVAFGLLNYKKNFNPRIYDYVLSAAATPGGQSFRLRQQRLPKRQ